MSGDLLAGQVALVTGASRGIGLAIARTLAAEGARVVLAARNQAVLEDAASAIVVGGAQAESVCIDVASRESVESVIDGVVKRHGRLDILVNNAGLTRDNLLVRMKDEEWRGVLDTNLGGAFLCTQAVLRPMLKQRSGRVINVASVVGLTGNAGQANYAASKAGLVGFTKAVAREVASRGITVNAVAPGFIETDMTAGMTPKARDAVVGAIPMGRVGRPEDVVGAVVYLASAAAAYVTGQVLVVDGGFHM